MFFGMIEPERLEGCKSISQLEGIIRHPAVKLFTTLSSHPLTVWHNTKIATKRPCNFEWVGPWQGFDL